MIFGWLDLDVMPLFVVVKEPGFTKSWEQRLAYGFMLVRRKQILKCLTCSSWLLCLNYLKLQDKGLQDRNCWLVAPRHLMRACSAWSCEDVSEEDRPCCKRRYTQTWVGRRQALQNIFDNRILALFGSNLVVTAACIWFRIDGVFWKQGLEIIS